MTFADKSIVVGRQAASILELDLDGCQRSYGVSPCTANLGLQNLQLQSEVLENSAHSKTNLTVNVNTGLGDDGTTTADKLEETAINAVHQVFHTYSVVSGVQYTYGAFFRPDERTLIRLVLSNATAFPTLKTVTFDLSNLTVIGTAGSPDSYGIRIAKNGLIRVWITDTAAASTTGVIGRLRLLDATGAESYLGVLTEGLEVWGVQFRSGQFPGKYAKTTTVAVDGGGSADDLCFNTFGTCQDTPNYLKEVRTYRFMDNLVRPVDAIAAYPSVKSVRYSSTQLKPGGKFSTRGSVTVTLQDFADTDAGVDDYQVERSVNQESQGTFFGKLKERNPFYVGRPMRVLEGYVDAPYSLANFRTREYIIENIAGPTADGKVTITGKDILALARDDRSKAPEASTETLRAAMTAGQTTLLPQVGEAAGMLLGDKHVRINDEIIELVSESPTDTLNVVRARGGTTGAAHAISDSVQECLTFVNEPVIDVINTLLTTFAGIPSSFIPTTDWEAEEAESLSGYDLETIITQPTGVTKLIQEICEITLIDLWYSDVDQEIKLKLQTPFTDVTETWGDDNEVVAESLKTKDDSAQRLSRVLIYYGMRNFAEKLKEPENFSFINFEIEADKEGVNKYADEKIRTIFSRWFDGSNAVQVALTSQRLLLRFGITPIEVAFDIDAKDVQTLQVGDVYDLNTRVIQDVNGLPKTTRFQIVESKPKVIGHSYAYKSLAFFQDPTPDTLTITANVQDYDVFVELGGPPGAVDVTLTINAGVDVDGTTGNPAITTAGMHPDSTLRIVNNGDIRGYGGAGGKGDNASVFAEQEGGCSYFGSSIGKQPGTAGGDAINATIDVTIDNTNGNIWAGAGGGGGGDGLGSNSVCTAYGGGGGGGGIGTDTGNAGAGGTHITECLGCGPILEGDGVAGTDGSTSAAGTGGAKGGVGAGDGGDGGADWGDDGIVGGSGGASGGVGGFAVRLNGNAIVWEGGNTAAKVKGDVA